MHQDPRQLRDEQLMNAAKRLTQTERRLQALQIRVLAEIARRRLHLRAGYDSLFSYLVKELGYAKACAYQRSKIAKASVRWPEIFEMIEDRRLSLATAAVVAKHLDEKNGAALLQACIGKSKEEAEMIVAGHVQTPVIPDVIRPVGIRTEPAQPQAGSGVSGKEDESKIAAVAVEGPTMTPAPVNNPPLDSKPDDVIVKISFATNRRVTDKLSRVKDLLARKHPQGALSDVFEELLDEFLNRHDPQIKATRRVEAAAKRKEQGDGKTAQHALKTNMRGNYEQRVAPLRSRYIPMAVKHKVALRDGGRCTFVSPQGVRCCATRHLEWDHLVPFALGGSSTDLDNIRLVCSKHNRERARQTFGEPKEWSGGSSRTVAPDRRGGR